MENHSGPRLPVFLIPFSLQPLLTLGTMRLCAEGFPAPAAETVPFVMAWERKNGGTGLDVRACESLTSRGRAGCSNSPGPPQGARGAWPEPTPGGCRASCRVPALNRITRARTASGLGVGQVWFSKAIDDTGATVRALGPRSLPPIPRSVSGLCLMLLSH